MERRNNANTKTAGMAVKIAGTTTESKYNTLIISFIDSLLDKRVTFFLSNSSLQTTIIFFAFKLTNQGLK